MLREKEKIKMDMDEANKLKEPRKLTSFRKCYQISCNTETDMATTQTSAHGIILSFIFLE